MSHPSSVISPELSYAKTDVAALHPEATNGAPLPFAPQLMALFSPEYLADWVWAYDRAQTNGFNDYIGRHVAILNKTIVNSGTHYARLRMETAESFEVDPERIVIMSMPANFANLRGES